MEVEQTAEHMHVETSEPKYRYCSEFIIKQATISHQRLQEVLASKGIP